MEEHSSVNENILRMPGYHDHLTLLGVNLPDDGKQVAAQVKKPKSGPKPETKCFYCKGTGHWKRKCLEYLVDKKDGKVNKGIFDIQVIDVYLTSVYSSP